jgi:hypothetical protein
MSMNEEKLARIRQLSEDYRAYERALREQATAPLVADVTELTAIGEEAGAADKVLLKHGSSCCACHHNIMKMCISMQLQ